MDINMTNEAFQALHDKKTRGLPLSPDEEAGLDAWYKQRDHEESALVSSPPRPAVLAMLQAQVQTVNAELRTAAQQIQEVTAENARIRDEISRLEKQAARRSTAQPA